MRGTSITRWSLLCPLVLRAFLLSSLLLDDAVEGLVGVVVVRSHRVKVTAGPVVLHAKKTTGKQRSSKGGGGGFGRELAPEKDGSISTAGIDPPDHDYAIFPALEPRVLETLMPALSTFERRGARTDGLSVEIVQRIDQIYGFPRFNHFPTIHPTEADGDLLMSSPSTASLDSDLSSTISFTDLLLATSSNDVLSTSIENDDHQPITTADELENASTTDPAKLSATRSTLEDLDLLPAFPHVHVLHVDPLVLSIDHFFTSEECDRYVAMSSPQADGTKRDEIMQSRSPTVGKDAAAKAQRTSTTWYHHYKGVPELMAKASRLLGLTTLDCWEEPQIVRYRRNEKFTWHLDALGPMENQQKLGGQRIATLLVYLTELSEGEGGGTVFRDLVDAHGQQLRMRPQKGSALLFFPAAGGIPHTPLDIRTLHCGEVVHEAATQDKWISQLWLRAHPYRPTAPPGNRHDQATAAVAAYCRSSAVVTPLPAAERKHDPEQPI